MRLTYRIGQKKTWLDSEDVPYVDIEKPKDGEEVTPEQAIILLLDSIDTRLFELLEKGD